MLVTVSRIRTAGLEELYDKNTRAKQKGESNREDIGSLLNLITRLDFNGFYASKRRVEALGGQTSVARRLHR